LSTILLNQHDQVMSFMVVSSHV